MNIYEYGIYSVDQKMKVYMYEYPLKEDPSNIPLNYEKSNTTLFIYFKYP